MQLYKQFSEKYRLLTGWAPFSLGDVLYGAVVVFLISKIVGFIKRVRSKKTTENKAAFSQKLLNGFSVLAIIYIIFNVFWGLNYNRKGIAGQLGLQLKEYSTTELTDITRMLAIKANEWKLAAKQAGTHVPRKAELFSIACNAYDSAALSLPYLTYSQPSVKPSLFSYLGNYLGFTGYYNPFSGEAQVNTTVPAFLQPYTTCHEIAHQLGYAKEMEANFVGYLAASASSNPHFRYSVYLDLFTYASRNLYYADSNQAKKLIDTLSTDVKNDIKEWKEFNRRHRNAIEPVIRWIYGIYLQGNEQPQGILAYDEVNGFLIAYYKKYGKL